jgi:hypothetical protein
MAIEPQADGQYLPKLTNWANEPDLRSLKLDYENAQQSHTNQIAKIDKWALMMKGGAVQKVKGRSSVQPKLIQQQAEWRYSALSEPFLGSDKIAKISPVTFEDTAGAKQNELLLNWQFRTKLNRVKLIDDYVRSVTDDGTCVLRTGWCRHTITIMVDQPVYEHYALETQEQADIFEQALALSQEDPHTFNDTVDPAVKEAIDYFNETNLPTYAVQVGTQKVPTEKVLQNKPVVDILNPRNVVIDPSCLGDIDKANFAVVSFETNKAELLKYPNRYKNLDQVNWEGNTPVASTEYSTTTPDNFNFSDSMRKKVVAYEYWGFYDVHNDGRLVPFVATWIGNVLIRMEENPYPDEKLPFVVVTYRPVKLALYGEPDAELLADQQNIIGAVTRGMIDLLGRSANGQQGFAKGMLDPLNRRRYDNGQDYEFNPNSNPSQNLLEHKMPEFPQSALTMIAMQNNQAESLTGVKSFSGGVTGEAYGEVAAGIRGVLDAASKREMAILRRLAKGMADVFNKIIAMNAVFLSEQEVVRVTNNEFVVVSREDLQGNYDLEVDISTAEVDNQQSQDLAFMLQTLGPNGDPGMVMMILAEIADLKRMPELAQKLRTFKPEPTPEQVKLQQLEIQNKELENQKLQSEIELNQAKAQFELSRKDKTDLDYVEQETGTAHERDMQKQRAQSQGNQNLQVTKALTTPTKEGEKAPNVRAAIGYNSISDKLNDDRPSSTIQRDELVGQVPPTPQPQYFNPADNV